MRKGIVFAGLLFLVVSSYGIAVAAPLTAPPPLSIFSQPFVLYDSGFVSGPLDLEVASTGCSKLLVFVFNNSVGAINLPVTLNLEFVYPPLSPPACSGPGHVAVSLMTLTVNSDSSNVANFPYSVIPPCLHIVTSGPSPSYSVGLLCN